MAAMGRALSKKFYEQDTLTVAKELLGKTLCRKIGTGPVLKSRIVETEAYLGIDDPAAHTFKGRRSKRNQSMYLSGGHAYVYLIYGMYDCLNFVTRTPEHPEAVLIRAVEPLHPKVEPRPRSKIPTNGPGKLCRHYSITRKEDGLPLWKKDSPIWVEDAIALPIDEIVATTRIGVDYAGEAAQWPLRFYVRGNPFISKK